MVDGPLMSWMLWFQIALMFGGGVFWVAIFVEVLMKSWFKFKKQYGSGR